jgi:hypothetical protein
MALLALGMLILTFMPAPVGGKTFPEVARIIKHSGR